MALSDVQRQHLEKWMRSKAIIQCPACGDAQWQFAEASYVRALLEQGEPDLAEDKGVVKVSCGNCGHVVLFDASVSASGGCGRKGEDFSPR
jgi:ribosomal protein S27E